MKGERLAMKCLARFVFAVPALLCLINYASPARADSLADARQAIVSSHARIDAALAKKDFAATTDACAPDFVSTNIKGEHFTASQVRSDLIHSLERANTVQSTTTIQNVTITPGGASTTLTQHMYVITPYRVLFVKRYAHTTLNQTRREDWVATPKGWLLSRSKTLSNISHTSL